MAISPIVQQHQQDMMGGGEAAYHDEQKIFHSKFGNAAYNTFNAKYPQLSGLIVTFKVVDSDLENSRAIGAFIVTYGRDVVYIPTVLSNGVISSCEMMYNKEENLFSPLVKDIITDIVNKNMVQDPKVVDKMPPVEDTSQVFANMFRPPSSSNPVLASGSMLDTLPNSAKEKISNYLQGNPELLAKIAEFYPLESLAQKLAKTQEKTAGNTKEFALPDVLGISALTKEAAQHLTKEQKEALRTDGFLVKAGETDFADKKNLPSDLVNNLQLTQKTRDGSYGTGKIAVYDPVKGELELIPALITPEYLFYKKEGEVRQYSQNSYLVSEFRDYITEEDLITFGASPGTVKPSESNTSRRYSFFYPTKSDSYFKAFHTSLSPDVRHQNVDGEVSFVDSYGGGAKVSFSNSIIHGKIEIGRDTTTIPTKSLYLRAGTGHGPGYSFIKSLDEFFSLVDNLGLTLSLVSDGAGYAVKDSTGKSKSLNSSQSEKVASYLHSEYRLGQDAINSLLKNKEIFLFTKQAMFTQPAVEEQAESVETSAYPEIVDDTVDLGSDELLETGMIASVADEEEVKPLLVDMLPKFVDTNSDLGKTIMLLAYDQENLEDFYGQEEYNSTLTKSRRVFRSLGEIVSDLKKYINMQ